VKRAIDKLRDLVREERYQISIHANEEMANDLLEAIDVENAILTGSITKRFTKDPRGTRYEVTGEASDGRTMAVICRIVAADWLTIVTVFALNINEP
jgi:Domain of unknown function (DUF4258)